MTGLRFLIHERNLWNNVVEATEILSDDGELEYKGLPGWGRELGGGCLGWAERKFCKDRRLPSCDGQHVSTFSPAIVTAPLQFKCPEASTRDVPKMSLIFHAGVGAAVRDVRRVPACSTSTFAEAMM
jgi:hypothetical protein